jgi:hypothetical protein
MDAVRICHIIVNESRQHYLAINSTSGAKEVRDVACLLWTGLSPFRRRGRARVNFWTGLAL